MGERRVPCLGASALGEVVEDLADQWRIEEEREDPHLGPAMGTSQGIDPLDVEREP